MQIKKFQTIIVGGGLSGLTLAHRFLHDQPEHDFCLLEKKDSTGGVISTFRQNGIVAEPGPHGFLDNCEQSRQLLRETGLDKIALSASLKTFVRYVYHEGKLKMIAQTPGKILTAPLISPFAKLGVLRDLIKPYLAGEPSVAQWCEHRFGPALLPYLDAAFTGTYAGDINRLSIDGTMPGLRALEKEHGSIIRGMLAKRRKDKEEKCPHRGLPAMTSFPKGMQQLVDTLATELNAGENLFCGTQVKRIVRDPKELYNWRLIVGNGEFQAQNLVLAVPVNTALALLAATERIHREPPIKKLPKAAIANIAMVFDKSVNIPQGFGFLVPEQERKFILGALFSSNMFEKRVACGEHLLEVMVGGRHHPERLKMDEKEMIAAATADIQEILQIKEPPLFTRKLPEAGYFPQPEAGYPALLAWKKELEVRTAGLFLCGFGWGGIGVNDMIKESFFTAANLLSNRDVNIEAEVKKIYF